MNVSEEQLTATVKSEYRRGFVNGLIWSRVAWAKVPEINPLNYSHEDVVELNNAVIETYRAIQREIEMNRKGAET